MRKILGLIVAVTLVATLNTVATADIFTYSWEDGTSTILGSYGNLVDPTNVSGEQTGLAGEGDPATFTCPGANSGVQYLHVAEEPHSSTPQAYVGFVFGLEDGDTIDASFFGFDAHADASPSLRIWGHYTSGGEDMTYAGSSGGSNTYTSGIGWEELSYSWTFDSDGGANDGLVIEARLYSTPSTGDFRTDYFIDDVSIEVTSGDGDYTVATPGYTQHVPEPATIALLGLGVVGLIRRR